MKYSTSLNKVAVITGASAGIGRAITRIFADHGYNLGLIARDNQRLLATKKEAEEKGVKVLIFPVDVSDYEKVQAALQEIEAQLGPVDIWINNAMVTVYSEIKDMLAEEYKRVTDVTYLGYVYGTMAALKSMWPRNQGTIVQVGSVVAYRAIPLQSAYCAAKQAIKGFTDSLRTEIMHHRKKIRLTMVQLPAVNTPQFSWAKTRLSHKPQPVPPIFQPEVAAYAIYWASQHNRREVIVSGINVFLVAATKFFPGLTDKYLAKNGYKGQQTKQPVEKDRPSNLWEPVPGMFAARGDFSKRAKSFSWQLWLSTHRFGMMVITLILLGLLIGILLP